MPAERSVAVRIAVKDVEQARARLLSLGEGGEAALGQIERAAPRASAQLRALDRTAATTAGTLRGGLGLQNLGFQIQDFAVQVAGGTSALRAFTLQAPQALSAFGPQGAALGSGFAEAPAAQSAA